MTSSAAFPQRGCAAAPMGGSPRAPTFRGLCRATRSSGANQTGRPSSGAWRLARARSASRDAGSGRRGLLWIDSSATKSFTICASAAAPVGSMAGPRLSSSDPRGLTSSPTPVWVLPSSTSSSTGSPIVKPEPYLPRRPAPSPSKPAGPCGLSAADLCSGPDSDAQVPPLRWTCKLVRKGGTT